MATQAHKLFTTWQLMSHFGSTVAPPRNCPERSSRKGERWEDAASDHGGPDRDQEASSAPATDEVASVTTAVTSHTSLRSSTRMTPSKKARNQKRAERHQQGKEKDKQREREQQVVDMETTTKAPDSGDEGVTITLLDVMDAVPAEYREAAIMEMVRVARNFIAPPGPFVPPGPPVPADASSAGTAGAAALAAPTSPAPSPSPAPTSPVPSPTSPPTHLAAARPVPPRPPIGARGLGRWVGGQWVPDSDLYMPPSLEESLAFEDVRMTFFVNATCPFCMKVCTEGHLASAGHRAKALEVAHVNLVLGTTEGPRTWTPVICRAFAPTPQVPMTADNFVRHWGRSFPHGMTAYTMRVLQGLGIRCENRTVRWPEVVALEPGLIEYSGQGKYSLSTPFYPFSTIQALTNGNDDEVRPGDEPYCERLIDDNDRKSLSDPCKAFWPVTRIVTDRCDRVVPRLRTKCYIVCVMQLFWPEPRAWEAWRVATSRL